MFVFTFRQMRELSWILCLSDIRLYEKRIFDQFDYRRENPFKSQTFITIRLLD